MEGKSPMKSDNNHLYNSSRFEFVEMHTQDAKSPWNASLPVKERIEKWSETRTKIPPGEYQLMCLEAKKERIWHQGKDGWGESTKAILWFEVFGGKHMGAFLPAFLPVREKITQGQKYFLWWFIANGCRRPVRNRLKDMAFSKFKGKVFRGEVVDVKSKYPNGKPKPGSLSYSRVDILYELIIGNPDAQKN
jgi:hypothetical protein